MNPHDSCVDNRLVNGLQQPILLHVYECKFSHNDPKVNDIFIGVLHEEYQSVFEYGSGTTIVKRIKFQKT